MKRKKTKIEIWDNEGKTYDRYTVIINNHHIYTMSHNAGSIQGACIYYGSQIDKDYLKKINIKVNFSSIPESIQETIYNLI